MKKKQKKTFKIGKKTAKNDFEYQTYLRLIELVRPKHNVEYEVEKLEYTTTHNYLPDFRIKTKKGKIIYIETKGNGRSFDSSVRQKMIAVKEQHPDLDIRILFYSDGKIGPRRKNGTFRKQSDWATENGFTFAIRQIPEEWINE